MRIMGISLKTRRILGEIPVNNDDFGEILGANEEALDLVLGRGGHDLKRLNRGDSCHDPVKTSRSR